MMTGRGHLRRRGQGGSALVEFTMAGIACLALMICTVELSLAMWYYHTLAYAVHETNRYIVVHGRDCSLGGNSCTITVGNIVSKFEANAIGIPLSTLNLTLTSQSGTVKSCSPVTNCAGDATQWPPDTNWDNGRGNLSTVKAAYTSNLAIVSLWFGSSGSRINNVTFTSQSQLAILF